MLLHEPETAEGAWPRHQAPPFRPPTPRLAAVATTPVTSRLSGTVLTGVRTWCLVHGDHPAAFLVTDSSW